ncbi:MAG: recombinase family protein [Opitutaceae bacterium]|nr:recombinase family protein [Opitutaceae bacterium]
MNDKITAKHLARAGYVYVRQSTLQQVRHNVESHRRQYALQERARELGFKSVVVIDDDLGISGSGHRERPGFARLLSAVCAGEVGGVFALEASRLARNNRDWHHLIDLCVLTETLVVDAEGVYDPRLVNDRLLLGLKGTMSEFELGILRQRAQEAYRQKVLRGEVLTRVPIGYVRIGEIGIEMTPNLEIQEAIRGIFHEFERLGTLRQVLLRYHREKIQIPRLHLVNGVESVVWCLPDYQQLLRILKSPTYAGAFAWGRSCCRSHVVDGRSHKTGNHRLPMDKWGVLIRDHHAAYISWDRYLENIRILSSNRTKHHAVSCGAPREGRALLAGLLRCACCGNKLRVAYRGRDGRAARYYCMTGSRQVGEPSCLTFAAIRADAAVVAAVLEACQPLGIEASLEALKGNRADQDRKRKALELALQRARYEADRAQRQFDAADPANRLVAGELENRWNTALAGVAEAEERLRGAQHGAAPITEEQRQRMLTLGSDLQALWDDPAAPVELKKRIIRTLINEIIVDVNDASGFVEMKIHWAGGTHTSLHVPKNKTGCNGNAISKDVVELVRDLAKSWPDAEIATMLNRLGHHTGPGNGWNETRVKNFRGYHKIPVHDRSHDRTWITMAEAAAELKVSTWLVKAMVDRGTLPAKQVVRGSPWIIQRVDLRRDEVKRSVERARMNNRVPRREDGQTLMPYL